MSKAKPDGANNMEASLSLGPLRQVTGQPDHWLPLSHVCQPVTSKNTFILGVFFFFIFKTGNWLSRMSSERPTASAKLWNAQWKGKFQVLRLMENIFLIDLKHPEWGAKTAGYVTKADEDNLDKFGWSWREWRVKSTWACWECINKSNVVIIWCCKESRKEDPMSCMLDRASEECCCVSDNAISGSNPLQSWKNCCVKLTLFPSVPFPAHQLFPLR